MERELLSVVLQLRGEKKKQQKQEIHTHTEKEKCE